MNWTQVYNPTGNMVLSFIVALIPILFFFWALAIKKMKGHYAGLLTVLIAILVAVIFYGMPISLAIESTVLGAANGLWPIGWIIVAAVFLYKLAVKAGQFELMRSSIASLTEDRRLQALLIAFSFGAFLEGAAGFGTPVAIAGALLAGIGFNPFYAAGLCLIANTAPVAFGAIGSPIIAAAQVSGINSDILSQMIGRQLPVLSAFVPFWLIFIMAGWKKTIEVLPAILVCGLSFAVTQFLTSNYLGPELPDIASSIVSLVALALFLKIWRPKSIFRFKNEEPPENKTPNKTAYAGSGLGTTEQAAALLKNKKHSGVQIFKAWSPFLLLIVIIGLWGGFNSVKKLLSYATVEFPIPGLNNAIFKAQPIVDHLTPYAASYKWDILGAAGTAILITAFVTKFIYSMPWKIWCQTFIETLKELRHPLIMIASVLGLAYICNYSGMSATLGLAFASTGVLFPFFAPLLGWTGVFLTGSDTSSNALFGNLQRITGQQIGVDPTLLVAANSSGGVTGKMISPQSIAVATAATGQVGKEGSLFRFTMKHSLLFVLIVSVITVLEAYVISWIIP
ncbi:L-lactate permease [Scopulibacillus cellulosilyticus]|uniref:L-lactate permease n=1 Tax=Scopulibacillus cellulosilyticus TaxID=2665665 RepID=A0ABW2PX95_9BACL